MQWILALLVGLVEVEHHRTSRSVGILPDRDAARACTLAEHRGEALHLAGARQLVKRQARVRRLCRTVIIVRVVVVVIVVVIVFVLSVSLVKAVVVVVVVVVEVACEEGLHLLSESSERRRMTRNRTSRCV